MGPDRRYLPRAWSPADLLTSPPTGAVPRRGRRPVGVGLGKRSVLGPRRMPHATTSFPSKSRTNTPRRPEGQPHHVERDNPTRTHDGDHHIHRLPVPILAAQDHPACPQVVLTTHHGGYRDASITMVAVTSSAVCGSGSPMPAWSYNRVTLVSQHHREPRDYSGNAHGLQIRALLALHVPLPGRIVGHERERRVACRGRAAGGRLASPDTLPRPGTQRQKGAEGAGNCRSIGSSVNRFVNRMLRDSVKRGRRSRQGETGSVPSAEVTAPARDCLRRQRKMSYGS
jgi:hypothetical protein